MNIERVDSLNDPRLEMFTHLTDPQLRNRIEPERGIFIAESEKVITRACAASYEPLAFLMEEKWLPRLADTLETYGRQHDAAFIPVFLADQDQMATLTGYEVTRGALAAFRRPPLPRVEDVCATARRIAVLEDLTNAVNVGAIFRNAAALGVDAVLLTPGCCDPLYRRALRVSMGNTLKIPWTYIGDDVEGRGVHGNVERAGGWGATGMPLLRACGFQTVALALRDDALSLDDSRLKAADRLAIILGTEGEGLSLRTIQESDFVVRIPMSHGVDSLNVATASALAFWELGAKGAREE